MGLCISALGVADDAVNDFLDKQSRYYKESKLAKEHLAKKQASPKDEGGADHLNEVLKSELSPIHPSLPDSARKYRDTLTLNDGSKVRLVGVDTPELKEKQPFALEAKEYTKKYCHDKDVWLTFGEEGGVGNEKNKDHYGRLLALIWVPLEKTTKGTMKGKMQHQSSQWLCVNEGLVASGLAHSYSPSGSKKLHNRVKVIGLQKHARVNKLGQWKEFQDYDAIITPSGSAFHKCKTKGSTESECKFLARSKRLSLTLASNAYDRGQHPCRNCFG